MTAKEHCEDKPKEPKIPCILKLVTKDMIGDENYTEADKKNSRKVLPHKNCNDSGRSVPKRTARQER